ncbi:MAG: hypothetical protein RSB78_05395 [Oscillospiraceae bacterium]
MTDYKEMYLKLFRANEQAINTLISAQQECETLYLNSSESEPKVISILTGKEKNTDEE